MLPVKDPRLGVANDARELFPLIYTLLGLSITRMEDREPLDPGASNLCLEASTEMPLVGASLRILLALGKASTRTSLLRDHLGCWGSNPDRLYAKQGP